ncbi:hypothetical protein ACWKWU_03200 [Chitinophaga lutea]
MNIFKRLAAPTPSFFQKARNWGLVLTALGSAIASMDSPVASGLTDFARYFAVAGVVLSGVSQTTVKNE